jgi:Zn-finger protein
MISFNGQTVHCKYCASENLVFIEDELMKEMSESKEPTQIKCNRCHAVFSKELIEENIDTFTSEEIRTEIINKKMRQIERYRQMEPKPEPVDEEKRDRKKAKEDQEKQQRSLT